MAAKKAAAKAETPTAAPAADSGIYLDPQLAEIRDAEMAKLAAIVVEPRPDATIDDALVAARNAKPDRKA